MRNYKGPILLLITAMLWGFAFVAQTAGGDQVGAFTFNFSRNFVGALFLTGVIYWRKQTGVDKPYSAPGSGYTRRTFIIAGVSCGVVLFLGAWLQQAGINSYPDGTAASGRSGFITALYMVIVALYSMFAEKKTHPIVFLAVIVAVVGMWFLCVPNGFGNLYWGDVLVFICAFAYAAHIIVIDRFTQVDGVRLSRLQLLISGSIALVCAMIFEHPEPAQIAAAAIPILYAGICSDGIAYTLQIIAQKSTDPTVASILMSLESVFAGLGGWLILSESLTPIELFGCVLVLAAVMLAQVPEFRENALKKKQAQG